MVKIKYIEFNGKEHVIEVEPGMSVMQGAVKNGVNGAITLHDTRST